MTDVSVKFQIKKFDGSDFKIWKLRTQIALRSENCETSIIDGFSIKNEDETINAERSKKDQKAMFIITSALSDSILNSVYDESALGLWKNLINKFEAKSLQQINFTRRQFFNCKQEENETVEN